MERFVTSSLYDDISKHWYKVSYVSDKCLKVQGDFLWLRFCYTSEMVTMGYGFTRDHFCDRAVNDETLL